MKYIGISILLGFTLLSCKDLGKQATSIFFDTDSGIALFSSEPAIQVDTVLLRGGSDELKLFYETKEFAIGWALRKNRTQLIEAIHDLTNDGMSIAKYNIDILEGYNSRYDSLSDSDKAKSDVYFSKAYFNATEHLFNGVLNARRLYIDWDINKKELKPVGILNRALLSQSIVNSFDSLRTKQPVYVQNRVKMVQLNKLYTDSLQVFASAKVLDTISGLAALKKHLQFFNMYEGEEHENDVYSKKLVASLKKYQTKNKLSVTGFLDTKTIESISTEKLAIKEKLVVNLERWRWFPQDFGEHYILVNIPEFSLVSVSNNDTIQKHKVVVGKIDRKTPILSSVLTTVVINPTWTVPPTIKKNDLVPSATRNLSYFATKNFTIYDTNGKVVQPENWNASKGTSYRYVQKGGVGNTLGRVKFMFNNNHSVYLHDTPSKYGFSRDDRSLSSGCVRVENPFELANFIFEVEKSNLTKEKIDEVLSSQKTTNYGVSKVPIEIHQLYWTVQVDQEGNISYFKDIYDYDSGLYRRLLN